MLLIPFDGLHPVGTWRHRYAYILVWVHIHRDNMRLGLAIEQLYDSICLRPCAAVNLICEVAVFELTLLSTVTAPDAGNGISTGRSGIQPERFASR